MKEKYLVIISLDGNAFCEEHLKVVTQKNLISFFQKTIKAIGHLANFSIELDCFDTDTIVAPYVEGDYKKVAHFEFVKVFDKVLRNE